MATSFNNDVSDTGDATPRLHVLCADFEQRWREGTAPDIAEFLQLTKAEDRSTLLTLLIRIDVRERMLRGERPDATDYVTRFPTDRATILGIDWTSLSSGDDGGAVADASTILYPAPRRSKIGRFDLRDRLGVGGFGEVWRAFDTHLQRDVAIKIGHYGADDSAQVDMLLHEARSAGRLRHPAIVPVHEAAVEDRVAYIVSDFIPGETLSEKIKAGPFSFREAASIARKLAEAIAHAHERGIIHRDLKPANVLLDQSGEPHLTDFGVARRAAGDTTISKDGQALGTPAYMAPEQARGESTVVDHRADVYSNGLILFEMLAGRRAYPGDAREALQRVLLAPPQRLRLFRPDVPADLETIVEVSIARDPAERYQTAAAQAEDLARYLRGEPITARQGQWLHRGWHWARRRPLTAAALTLAAVVGTAGTASFASLLTHSGGNPTPPESSSDAAATSSFTPPADAPPPPATMLADEHRRVLIETKPKGAKFWLFPIDDRTGWPLTNTRIDVEETSPAWVDLKPGEYLIVADLGEGQFNEVTRWVPFASESIPFSYENRRWNEDSHGRIYLSLPIRRVPQQMELVTFPATEAFVVETGRSGKSRRLRIPPFQMARRELTVREYRGADVYKSVTDLQGKPDQAVTLRYDEAASALESFGLRLPLEYEWEYAARFGPAGGKRFSDRLEGRTSFGAVGSIADDLTGPQPGVFGLYTNVAELTSGRTILPWAPDPPLGAGVDFSQNRIVRGGHPTALTSPDELPIDVRSPTRRFPIFVGADHIAVGVRGVRSLRPRREPSDFVMDLGEIAGDADAAPQISDRRE